MRRRVKIEINDHEFKIGDEVVDAADWDRGLGKVVGIVPCVTDPGGPGDRFTVSFPDAVVSNIPGSHLLLYI